jgi:hypothetical protein
MVKVFARGCLRRQESFVPRAAAGRPKYNLAADNPEDGFCHLIIRL